MKRPDTIALFYDGYERRAAEDVTEKLHYALRGILRRGYRRLRALQPYTGFYTAFLNLRRSLEANGVRVRVNDFAYARKNPTMPVGICGFASVYDRVRLPNPAMFGPGQVPNPDKVLPIVEACNLRIVTQPSDWYCSLWRPVLGDRIKPMFVGIDTDDWPDQTGNEKTIDVIIYDKIRWFRDKRVPELLEPLMAHLDERGLSYVVLRYGEHHLSQFRHACSHARSMVFLCEHETQGLAYQEAMSAGVPILAWDEGELASPIDRALAPPELVVSSVPYFDERCGMRVKAAELVASFDAFFDAVPTYRPRDYILDNISLSAGARRYMELFTTLG